MRVKPSSLEEGGGDGSMSQRFNSRRPAAVMR